MITPETACFSEVVYLAGTPEAYLAAIERALREDSAELRGKRMTAVKGVSWDARFEETVAVLEKMLSGVRA